MFPAALATQLFVTLPYSTDSISIERSPWSGAKREGGRRGEVGEGELGGDSSLG